MDKTYKPQLFEEKIYQFWEKKSLFKAKVNPSKKPFSIILPPPNANANLHLGHALYVYEDIMIRYQKLLGKETLWLPGADHAGIETQFVFEKHLKKAGKSRFNFDRDTLYQMIFDFVQENRGTMESQLRRLGFALDWSRQTFTLDDKITTIVYDTFKKLYEEKLIYRAYRLVNYCTRCGTSFSDLEVNYMERADVLYYLKYGPFTLATVRPETLFGDTGIAVNPKDKRYSSLIGKEVEVEGLLGTVKLPVVGDRDVDPKFGTGVVKVTPAHDFTDYEIAKRHNLPLKQVIGFDGRLNDKTEKYKGLKVKEAREKVVEDLKEKGLMVKIKEDYTHRVGTCYRCGSVLEPLPKEQWFIKVKPLTDKAKKLVEENKVKIFPNKFKKQLIRILDEYIDWNISRQIVWGIRIPAYYCKSSQKWFVSTTPPEKCAHCDKKDFIQDEDTFDTWFSSGQWPVATLMSQGKEFYDYFYPTTVMETGYDILRAWVARMIMLGNYATKKVPFENVYLHGMLRDKKGQKMSKSKNNAINPMEMIDKYGADALRGSLVFGTGVGQDVVISEEKIIGMRNFVNKVWNIGRFITLSRHPERSEGSRTKSAKSTSLDSSAVPQNDILKNLDKEFNEVKKAYSKHMDAYRFSKAFGIIYEFLWHRFADNYIEELKESLTSGNIEVLAALEEVYLENLRLLHPFMPFVTEALWKQFKGEEESILLYTH